MRKLAILLLLCTGYTFARAQAIDSLQGLLLRAKKDTNAVYLYYTYGKAIEIEQPDSAVYYYKKARQLSEDLGYKKGIAAFASNYIVVLNRRGQFREALAVTEEALELYKEIGNDYELATAYNNVGNEWHYLSDYAQAAEYYLLSKKHAEKINHRSTLRRLNNNLAAVFLDLNDYEKGRQYAEASLQIAKELKDDFAIASSEFNLASVYMQLKQPEKAFELYEDIERIGHKLNDYTFLLDALLGKGDAYAAMNNVPKAKLHFEKTIAFSKEKEAPEYEMYAHMGMADLLLKIKDPAAGNYILQGIAIAQKQGSRLELKDLYLKASLFNESSGNLQKALDYRKEFELLSDSIIGERSRTTVANLEAKYEFEKKESRIKLQQEQLKQKSTLNYVLIGSAVALVIIFLLSYRNYYHKQKLQQARIDELEIEKQLTATEAILKGEEQERARLAKDLHDGLGGMLSGIKYSFQNMKGNLILTPENALAFERSIDMLDSSIREMRRVAHNMMPEILVKYGLNVALKEFCNEIDRSGVIRVKYQSIGMNDSSIEQTMAITVYRIVQELVNNAIKHAAASEVVVQLQRSEQLLSVTIEDDGRGFDTTSLQHAQGMGWSNIQNRVDFLKGKIDVDSVPDKGTSVLMEIPLS
ncbi:MAG: sensor histidine kinase [Cyclobacteriaceae bacterium]|nr:sensor histidine kinase [Cyclobacteriaceae bacterium]